MHNNGIANQIVNKILFLRSVCLHHKKIKITHLGKTLDFQWRLSFLFCEIEIKARHEAVKVVTLTASLSFLTVIAPVKQRQRTRAGVRSNDGADI